MDPDIWKIEDMFSMAGSGVEKIADKLSKWDGLILYSYFKQAMYGNATEEMPNKDAKEVYKWKHWN